MLCGPVLDFHQVLAVASVCKAECMASWHTNTVPWAWGFARELLTLVKGWGNVSASVFEKWVWGGIPWGHTCQPQSEGLATYVSSGTGANTLHFHHFQHIFFYLTGIVEIPYSLKWENAEKTKPKQFFLSQLSFHTSPFLLAVISAGGSGFLGKG